MPSDVQSSRMPHDPRADDPSTPTSTAHPRSDPFVEAQHLLIFVAVLAVVGTVVAMMLTQRLGTTYRDGLGVTADGAEVATVGATSAATLASNLLMLADSANASLDQARGLALVASDSTADLSVALGTNIAEGISGTASIADSMAGFVETIERFIPGDSDSLAEDLRRLADGIGPVPDQLRSLASQLEASSIELDAAAATIATITLQVGDLTGSIAEARTALVEVERLSIDVAERARAALDRSRTDLWLVRLLVLVVGLAVTGAAMAGHRSSRSFAAARDHGTRSGAGGGTRTHTPLGTGS